MVQRVAGAKVLLIESDIAGRVSCLARGASAERDVSWRAWNSPLEITADGRQLLLHGGTRGVSSVGLQPLDGSPITDLGEGPGYSFAADQHSVLVQQKPRELAFIPIGTGERVTLPPTKLDAIAWAVAAPNGKTVILAGGFNNVTRLYEKSIAGGELRRISDDPIYFPMFSVSPDSASVAATGPTYRVTVYRTADGKATLIPTSIPGDFPIRYADDGSLLYVRTRMPAVVYRFDFRTQRETKVREVVPADRAGVLWAYPRAMTSDAQCYCYQYAQVLSKLVLADRLDQPTRLFR